MPAYPIDTDQIVITASRAPEQEAKTPASVTVIDQQRIERLDEPLVTALLRLTPSAAVTAIGPAGSLTEPTMELVVSPCAQSVEMATVSSSCNRKAQINSPGCIKLGLPKLVCCRYPISSPALLARLAA